MYQFLSFRPFSFLELGNVYRILYQRSSIIGFFLLILKCGVRIHITIDAPAFNGTRVVIVLVENGTGRSSIGHATEGNLENGET